MTIVLDHTIVPAHDNEASAKFFAHIFGLNYEGSVSHFAPVRLNDTLVMDFDTCSTFDSHHYAFKVSEPEFDAIFQRVKDEGLAYGSGPFSPDNMADQPPRRRARVLLQGSERSSAGGPDSVVSPVVRSIGRAQFFVRGVDTSGRCIHPT